MIIDMFVKDAKCKSFLVIYTKYGNSIFDLWWLGRLRRPSPTNTRSPRDPTAFGLGPVAPQRVFLGLRLKKPRVNLDI
ncbi:hypothetical protein PRJ_Fausto_00500 [Faustovirus]|nr:hypothetical protein PRJ_Fausto_00500 [Faustovirus]